MVAKKKGRLSKSKTAKTATKAAGTAKGVYQDWMASAQQVWLAGLGALVHAQEEGPKFFESLVKEGAKFQDRSRKKAEKTVRDIVKDVEGSFEARMKNMKGQATESWDKLEKVFQDRVERSLHQIGVPTTKEINRLSSKVDELSRSVKAFAKTGSMPKTKRASAGTKKRKSPRTRVRTAA